MATAGILGPVVFERHVLALDIAAIVIQGRAFELF
jgi:hypothetical protein